MKRPFLRAATLIAAAFLVACTTTPAEPVSVDQRLADKGYEVSERIGRIPNFRLNGWSYVDRKHVIMTSGVRDRYLVTLKSNCPDLDSAMNIAYSTTAGALTDKDRLTVKVRGGVAHNCLIDRLHTLQETE